MSQKRVAEKVALVTGGALGLGEATCRVLAAEGARVAITDVNDEAGEALAARIREQDGVARYWHLDVRDEQAVKRVCDDVVKEFGGLDVLVNNAGISGANKPTDELGEEEWDAVMAVNVKGVFFCTKHAVPHLRARGGGSIVNLSSIYGLVSQADFPPYHASKGAVRLMSKTDAMLYAKDKIRVNSVHPGFIWTPMVEEVAKRSPQGAEAFREQVGNLHALGHMGEADDIAYGVLYLASDESKFVTGSELVIDGGYTAQ